MGFKCGIVGLPNVGKSTLFSALTHTQVPAENYPFCTIEPNTGIVAVPDTRLQAIANIIQPKRTIPAVMEFVDIAGLVKGASKGEGLGNQFLSHIRETQAIAHVVRCFDSESITHVNNRIDPIADIETINTELMLADLQQAQKAISQSKRLISKLGKSKAGLQETIRLQLLEQIHKVLEAGRLITHLPLNAEEKTLLQNDRFLTAKPVLYVSNIAEGQHANNPYVLAVKDYAAKTNASSLTICANLESALTELTDEEKALFLDEMAWDEPGLNRLIRSGYTLLGLQTFFTAGPKELRAWTVKQGATAPQAAGIIHSDFEKGFIRAEVISYNDYIRCKGEQGAKDAGLWRIEGKDYIIEEGDILHFRHAN